MSDINLKLTDQNDGDVSSTINFEHTDQEYKEVPYQIHINYSSEGHDYRPNWHNEIEFIYTVSGSVEVYIENDCYFTKPGDIVAINRNKIHTFKGNNWKFHCVKIANPILRALKLSANNLFVASPLIHDEELSSAFLDIIEECHRDHVFSAQLKELSIQKFLLLFCGKYSQNYFATIGLQENSHFTISANVINYLNQHLSEDFSIDDIANAIGFSPSHISRCFKETTGSSIVDHLNRLRCYTAKHYLMHSDKKISEIATLCGYKDGSYFARTYKKFVGHAPNETPRKSLSIQN